MGVIFDYPAGKGGFPRAYIKGFMTTSDYTIVGLSGNVLEMTETGLDVQIYLVIQPFFLSPSSNVYSLDYVFDEAACTAFYLHVPHLFGLSLKLVADPIQFAWRILITGSSLVQPITRADLAPLPGYWLNHA